MRELWWETVWLTIWIKAYALILLIGRCYFSWYSNNARVVCSGDSPTVLPIQGPRKTQNLLRIQCHSNYQGFCSGV